MEVGRIPVADVTLSCIHSNQGQELLVPTAVSLAAALSKAGVGTVDVGPLNRPLMFQLAHTLGTAVPGLTIMAQCAMDRPQISHAREALKTARRARIGLKVPVRSEEVRGQRWQSYAYLLDCVKDYTSFAARLDLEVDLMITVDSELDPIFAGRLAQHAAEAGAAGVVLLENGNTKVDVFAGTVEKMAKAIPSQRIGVRCAGAPQGAAALVMAAMDNGATEAGAVAAPWAEKMTCPTLEALAQYGLLPMQTKQFLQLAVYVNALVGAGRQVGLQAAVSTMEP